MPMKIGDPVPDFDGATDWINGTAGEAAALASDTPLLVHFWAISCGVCKKNMPQLRSLVEDYKPAGLNTIAVHMPISQSDTVIETVKEAAGELGITEACAVDNLHKLKEAFGNDHGWVPVYYLFDGEGKMKIRAAGEFGVGMLKNALERMFPDRALGAAD